MVKALVQFLVGLLVVSAVLFVVGPVFYFVGKTIGMEVLGLPYPEGGSKVAAAILGAMFSALGAAVGLFVWSIGRLFVR